MKTPIADAKATVDRHALVPVSTRVPLSEADGLRLAADVTATEPMPAFDNSAMDGYAVRLPEEAADADPLTLPVIGEAQAGIPFEGRVETGEAVKISTGAVVPDGAERVIRIEDTDEGDDEVQLHDTGKPQNNIRFEGEEVSAGETVAEEREKITPPLVGRLASFGVAQVPVYDPPTVAVLNTGNELVDVDVELQPGEIRNSNRYLLSSLMRESGATLGPVASVPDTWDDTVAAIEQAAEAADVVLITGGVSVGPHDHVKGAAEEIGFERQFWKVKQKPGKPLFFATHDDTLLFGLPGNPFSAAINVVYYVQPLVRRCLGHPQPEGHTVPARMASVHERRKSKRTKFMLVRVEEVMDGTALLNVVQKQRSHMLSGLHESDGFVLAPVGKKRYEPSDALEMRLFPWADVEGIVG